MQVRKALQIGLEDPQDAVYNCQLKDDGAKMRVYDGKSKARLGTKKNPAEVTVQTEERRKDMAVIRHLWRCP